MVPEVYDEPEFDNVREIMKNLWLWIYNQNGWTDKGVYVVQDTEASGVSKPLNYTNLEKMLKGAEEIDGVRFSKDGSVRFAPKETYQLGDHTHESFAKDGFVRASVGIVGAEKITEVSKKFKYNPITLDYTIEEGQKPELRVPAFRDNGGYRLNLYGYYFEDYVSFAFGVL